MIIPDRRGRLYREHACDANQTKTTSGGIEPDVHKTSLLQVNDLMRGSTRCTPIEQYAIAMPANLLNDVEVKSAFACEIGRTCYDGSGRLWSIGNRCPGNKVAVMERRYTAGCLSKKYKDTKSAGGGGLRLRVFVSGTLTRTSIDDRVLFIKI